MSVSSSAGSTVVGRVAAWVGWRVASMASMMAASMAASLAASRVETSDGCLAVQSGVSRGGGSVVWLAVLRGSAPLAFRSAL